MRLAICTGPILFSLLSTNLVFPQEASDSVSEYIKFSYLDLEHVWQCPQSISGPYEESRLVSRLYDGIRDLFFEKIETASVDHGSHVKFPKLIYARPIESELFNGPDTPDDSKVRIAIVEWKSSSSFVLLVKGTRYLITAPDPPGIISVQFVDESDHPIPNPVDE